MTHEAGQTVFVPNFLVGRQRAETALSPFEIVQVGGEEDEAVHGRSVRVALTPDEDADDGWVATSLVHDRVGVVVVRIGDLTTESALLDPLAKTIDHYFRLLVGSDYVRVVYLRALTELEQFWTQYRTFTSHLVLIAHGRTDAVRLLGDESLGFEQWLTGTEVATLMDAHGDDPKFHVLSLCCRTGYAAFAQKVSAATAVRTCAGPIHDVHGAIASQFAQTLFAEHFLHGRTWPIAFKHARKATPGTSSFRLWKDSKMIHGASGP